jgi:hypothetical protein
MKDMKSMKERPAPNSKAADVHWQITQADRWQRRMRLRVVVFAFGYLAR